MAGPERHVAALDHEFGVSDWVSRFVADHSTQTPVCFLEELDERLHVVRPEASQLVRERVLAAGKFQRHLHAARLHVRVVRHAALERVPLGPVDDSVVVGLALAGEAPHGRVVERVGARQVLEHVVVRRPRLHRGLSVGVVVGVPDEHSASVQVPRQHEGDGVDPLAHGRRLGLLHAAHGVARVREVAVQVYARAVVPSPESDALPFPGDGHAVRVHAGHEVDVGVVQQPPDARVVVVAVDQVRRQVEHQLLAHHLVAVHIRHVLHGRLHQLIASGT